MKKKRKKQKKEICEFCGERGAIAYFHGKIVCRICWRRIKGGYGIYKTS